MQIPPEPVVELSLTELTWAYILTALCQLGIAAALERWVENMREEYEAEVRQRGYVQMMVIGVVAAPLFEEFVFRIVPWWAFGAALGPTVGIAALVMASLYWAHGHGEYGLATHIPAAIPCVLAVLAGRPLAAIGLHAFHNAWSITLWFGMERFGP